MTASPHTFGGFVIKDVYPKSTAARLNHAPKPRPGGAVALHPFRQTTPRLSHPAHEQARPYAGKGIF